jgi:hypothetical protein
MMTTSPQVGGSGMMGGAGALGGAGGAGRGGWVPLGSAAAASGPMAGGSGFPAAAPRMPAGAEGGGAEPTQRPGHKRTEFVVLFIWKEPTPSDDLMKPTEDTGPPSTGTAGGGSSGGMSGGSGMMGGGGLGLP